MVILLIQKIMSLFLMMVIGFILVRSRVMKAEDSVILSKFIVYGVTPCTIINAFQVDLKPEIRLGMVLAFIGAASVNLVMIIISEFLTKVFKFNSLEKASIIYSNAGNLIIPIVAYVLGADWVIYTSGYITVQTILLWSHGCSLVSGERGINIKKIVKNINMIAVAVGLVFLFAGIRLPSVLGDMVSSMGSMIGPLSMVVTGMLIGGRDILKMFENRKIWAVIVCRLLILPVCVLFFLKYTPLHTIAPDGRMILLVTYLSAMGPTAATITNQAQVYARDPEYAGAINAVTSFLCMLTMPVMVYLYQM